MSPSAAIATSRTAPPQALATEAYTKTGIRLSPVAQAVTPELWVTASRARTTRKPKICTGFHGHGSRGPTLTEPTNIIRKAIRHARTGYRYATATGTTEPAAMITITTPGSRRLSARYAPAAAPSP